MTKPIFDIEKSKNLCPPTYPKGVLFKKRITVKLRDITFPSTGNPRVYQVKTNELGPLVDSFTVNGYIHTQSPPTVKVDPENKDRFIGLSGYHRSTAAKMLGWETMMVDVLEFDSPKDERVHKTQTNAHKTPFIPMTIEDYLKQIKEAIACNEIENDDTDIKLFIEEIAFDKTEKTKEKLFKKLRSHVSTSTTLLTYHTSKGASSTQEFAKKFNLPFDGDKRYKESGDKLAYMNHYSTPKTSLVSAKKLSKEYKGQDVLFYTWIETPKESPALERQRIDHLESFNKFMQEEYEFIQMIAEKCGAKLNIGDIAKYHPFKFAGFLAQDITPDASKGGRPREEGVVDVYGNPV